MAGNDIDRVSFRLFGLMLKSALTFSLSPTGVPQFSYCQVPIETVIVQGTVVYLKRHYQFLHFVSLTQALDDMTGIIECVYFFTDNPETIHIGDKLRLRGKLRVYNDTIQVTARSGLRNTYSDMVETSDEELHWIQSAAKLLRHRKDQPEIVSCRRAYRSVRPLHYPEYLVTLEVIKSIESCGRRELAVNELERRMEGVIAKDKLKLKLCELAAVGLVDVRDKQGEGVVVLPQESIHPREQVLRIIQGFPREEGAFTYQIAEELSRCSVDMHNLLPMFLSDLVKSGAIYEVENRKFKVSR